MSINISVENLFPLIESLLEPHQEKAPVRQFSVKLQQSVTCVREYTKWCDANEVEENVAEYKLKKKSPANQEKFFTKTDEKENSFVIE